MSTEFIDGADAVNRPAIRIELGDELAYGWSAVSAHLGRAVRAKIDDNRHAVCVLGIDGYQGTDWSAITEQLRQALEAEGIAPVFLDVQSCTRPQDELDAMLEPYLGDDPVFGRLYKKGLVSLFDRDKLDVLNKQISVLKRDRTDSQTRAIVCYGTGALLSPLRSRYDLTAYADLTRQQALKRNRAWSEQAGKTQSISPKKLYYVDFQVNDRHRNRLLGRLDYYLDGNDEPILLSRRTLLKVVEALASWPFRLRPMHEPGPWGGQWLKEKRHLPKDWVNSAWSYEVIAPEQSLLVAAGEATIEFPWTTFFHLEYDRVMGKVPKSRFGGEFPIRFDYLDTMKGGDLSIQVHPTTAYVQEQFGEPYHQGEMYYIVDGQEGATVNLGLVDGVDKEAFFRAAKLADEQGIAFDYHDFVHQVPAAKHDLILIPPGTVHGSGEGLVVLEISATTYRYTFKIYDHLRPDLSGVMRPIHLNHASHVIKWFRQARWVDQNLKQAPRLVRSGDGWAEYMIGDRREFFHVVFRMEFDQCIEDDTKGQFHIMTLVEGESVQVASLVEPERQKIFGYAETIIVPADFGPYALVNQGQTPCKVVKARLR